MYASAEDRGGFYLFKDNGYSWKDKDWALIISWFADPSKEQWADKIAWWSFLFVGILGSVFFVFLLLDGLAPQLKAHLYDLLDHVSSALECQVVKLF